MFYLQFAIPWRYLNAHNINQFTGMVDIILVLLKKKERNEQPKPFTINTDKPFNQDKGTHISPWGQNKHKLLNKEDIITDIR